MQLSSEIWNGSNDGVAHYYAGLICFRGHVHSSDGKDIFFKPGGHCQQCGAAIIATCQNCEAPIRGEEARSTSRSEYVRPSFCYKCGKPYPWMQDRLQTARELLYHDDKLTQEDREKLWDLLKDVMSSPKDDLVPAKRKLIDIDLAKAAQVTREIITDLVAKTIAEIVKP
jgi:hypothetical protein